MSPSTLSRNHLYYPQFWRDVLPQFKRKTQAFQTIAEALDISNDAVKDIYRRFALHDQLPKQKPLDWLGQWPMGPYPGTPRITQPGAPQAQETASEGELEAQVSRLRPLFPDRKRPFVSVKELSEAAQERAEQNLALDPSQDIATIDLSKATSPLGIFTVSDLHWGAPQTDYKTFLKHGEYLETIPNLYAIQMGDIAEYSISDRMLDATLNQVFPPQIQTQVTRKMMSDLCEKFLASIGGNHELRSERKGGFDVALYILDSMHERGCPYLRDGGSLRLLVGQQVYTWLALHGDTRFGSMYNPNHKGGQLARMSFGRHDIVSIGHTHLGSMQQTESPGADGDGLREEVRLQAGSYKTLGHEGFTYRKGYMQSHKVIMPMVILDPVEKCVLPFFRVEDGVKVLRALNHIHGIKER